MVAPAIKVLMASGGGSTAPQLPDAIDALSPLGYWKLDEGSGTTANDSSGNGRNGTYTGSGFTLQGSAGDDGANYVDLGNAASSHIAIADHNAWSLDTASGLTVFMLLKPDSVSPGSRRQPIAKGSAGAYEWGVDCFIASSGAAQTGNMITAVWSAAGIARNAAQWGNTMTTAWQAVVTAMVTATTTMPTMYRNNNTNIGTSLGSSTSSAYVNAGAELRIGWRADAPNPGYWQGGIAHVAIFAGVLNTTDIGTLMDAASADGWF